MANDIKGREGNMKIFEFAEKNKNIVRWISIILILVPMFFQIFLSSLPLYQRFAFVLYSVIFLLLGYGGIYFVLGVQVILKIMPKKILKVACNFFISCGVLALLFQYPTILITTNFINTGDEAITMASIYIVFGAIIGSYRIKNKYTTE